MTTHPQEYLAAYARLAVETGVNLAQGQELIVGAQLDHAPLVRAIAEHAYRAGASYVDVVYGDPYVRRALASAGPDDALEWTPPWAVERIARARQDGAAALLVTSGGQSEAFAGVDQDRLARTRPLAYQRTWIEGVMERQLSWAIVGCPTAAWARELFGEADLERLWTLVGRAARLDEPDPVVAWTRRFEQLEHRAATLTARGFDALRYRGPGTELEVGLIEGARWIGGRAQTTRGQVHAPNIPTEEVFTTPHRLRAEGTIRSSLPLLLRGLLIEGLELRLTGGRIVEARAERGEEAVRADLATDEGALRLGEVALVDATSGVGQTGTVFRDTLFDENAASHIAWGRGVTWAVPDVAEGEHEARGVNQSATHVDFMIGSSDLEVDGVEPGGGVVPILRGGEWQVRD